MPRSVRAEAGPRNTVIFTDEAGKKVVYSGGDRTWRNNNPGNLVSGSISRRNGAIGVAGGFAVFPDREAGRRALQDSLKTTYGNKSLKEMIKGYAPPHENATARYLHHLRRQTGVRDNRKIKDFSATEFEKLWKAIERMEGQREGTITGMVAKKTIMRVRKNKKGTITAYFVGGMGWLSKDEGIALAEKREIDAVVATSRAGNLYLKARPDRDASNNLGNLG